MIHVCINVFSARLDWLLNYDFTDSDLLNHDWLNCWLARFVRVSNIKIINNLLSIHKFIMISVLSIEIIVIIISFDSILKSSSISTRIQYIDKNSIYHWFFTRLRRLSLLNLRIHSFDQTRSHRRQSEANQNKIHHEHA